MLSNLNRKNQMFTTAEVIKMLPKSPKSNGSFNLFCKLNNKIAVKLTVEEKHRDHNYELQTKAAEFELGPETYGKIDVVINNKTYYGYFTEVVETIDGYDDIYTDGQNQLVKDLRENINFYFSDCHPQNCGIKDGKLVCIDFDDEAFEDYQKRYCPDDEGDFSDFY